MSEISHEALDWLESVIDRKIQNALSKGAKIQYRGRVLSKDKEGVVWVEVPGVADKLPADISLVEVGNDDLVQLTIGDGMAVIDGNQSAPSVNRATVETIASGVIAPVKVELKNIVAEQGTFQLLQAEYAEIVHATIEDLKASKADIDFANITWANIDQAFVNALSANYAHITEGVIDNATISYADIEDLDANYAHITDGVIDNATISYADIEDLDANYAHITDGVIDNATIGYADVDGLDAHYAHITDGVIDNASIGYANVDDLDAHYAQIDLANIANGTITSAMIGDAQITTAKIGQAAITTALIADEAVGDSKIATVSANKLTAGTIDASKINVANLNAKNLIVEKINGQPVLGGLELVPSGSTGYSSKNPSVEGWYEMSNGSFVLSQDTEVDDSKAYYRSGTATRLYDQDYIDALETSLGDRIDGAIETFTSDAVPTLLNYPAADWTSADYENHIGDVCYVVNAGDDADGYCYRFAYDSTTDTYDWILIKDSDVTAALQRLIDAEGDISGLQSFQSDTQTWITNTDTELGSLQSAQTSLETRLTTAEGTLQTKVDTQTFNSVSNTVDSHTQTIQSMSTTVQTASTNASTALSTANTAVQTALDGAFLVLTSTNGQLFKNGTESTILQVAIFPNGGDRCDTLAQVRSRFGSAAYIEWKWKHDSDDQWGTLVSTDSHISHDGMWLTVTPADVAAKTSFSASLIVPGEED